MSLFQPTAARKTVRLAQKDSQGDYETRNPVPQEDSFILRQKKLSYK